MKRSKSLRLLVLGSLPLALSACDSQVAVIKPLSEVRHHQGVQQCIGSGTRADACNEARDVAQQLHYAHAPRFDDLNACQLRFEHCQQAEGNGVFLPDMDGFNLITERQVYDDGVPIDQTHWTSLRYVDAAPRYLAEPVYRARTGREVFASSALSEQGRADVAPAQLRVLAANSYGSTRWLTVDNNGFNSRSSLRSYST
ncbi:DUF1190 domain-containing protein [Pseudomonas rubra]|uniref:DUF1190 domain-containing protein n=1 Tax=Pseudomonas rubra TaxID=2942627 RepID=A0ABT5P1X5_9PSED|nr:DUF1190 domain-containing protein [Pseudomonas rubra]MDD1012250.1 DUF1190 domain-containing protein [Pseudomonas rubra]MDD1037403.1 DUF1190 domain-containing protein [Pseudomonas rubra]MDD1153120.1 DUF1190 domain-containing protein [Pseudomonas rubra]